METENATIMICLNVGCVCWIDEETDVLMSMPINADNTIDTFNSGAVEYEHLNKEDENEFRIIEARIRKIRAEYALEEEDEATDEDGLDIKPDSA